MKICSSDQVKNGVKEKQSEGKVSNDEKVKWQVIKTVHVSLEVKSDREDVKEDGHLLLEELQIHVRGVVVVQFAEDQRESERLAINVTGGQNWVLAA